MPSLLILAPLVAIVVMNLPFGAAFRRLSFLVAFFLLLAQAWAVIFSPPGIWAGQGLHPASLFDATLAADPLSLVMLLSIAVVAFAALFTGWHTLSDDAKRFGFVNLLLLAVIGMNGIVLVSDLFSLYVFLEIAAVASFILISFHKDRDALEGSFKYIILSAVATVLMLAAVALLFMLSGDTSFAGVKAALASSSGNPFAFAALALFLTGLFIKGGLVPFHGWLPDAYTGAPAGVSVLLAGIVTKTTGVYTVVRLVTAVFGLSAQVQALLLFFGAVSIVFGAFAALGQKDMKRMLAYSSISQVGYIVISLGAGTPLGIAGAVFHLFNHSVFKAQLFANAAAVEEQTLTRDMDRLGGLAARMPVTGATSVIGLLSTAGIPPLSGFWSKLIIIIALWTSGNRVYAAIAVIASVVTLAYFLSMQRRVFFGKLADEFKGVKEAPAAVVFPAVLLAIITIAVGIFFPFILDSFILPVGHIPG